MIISTWYSKIEKFEKYIKKNITLTCVLGRVWLKIFKFLLLSQTWHAWKQAVMEMIAIPVVVKMPTVIYVRRHLPIPLMWAAKQAAPDFFGYRILV